MSVRDRRPSEVQRQRAQRHAEGVSIEEIAADEGVTEWAVRETIHLYCRRVASLYGGTAAERPLGTRWHQRHDGTWYVAIERLSPSVAQWAVQREAECGA